MQFAVKAAEDPAGAVDGPGVAEGFVAGGLGGTSTSTDLTRRRDTGRSTCLAGWTGRPGDVGVAVGEAHKAFAFEGGEMAEGLALEGDGVGFAGGQRR